MPLQQPPDRPRAMRPLQRLITLLLFPFARSIERHSRAWHMTCPCGHSEAVWDRGGIRWLATGEPRRYLRCQACGARTWHRVHRC